MGYVLPVDRYQYSEYQVRDVEDKRAQMRIDPAFKVVLERHHQEVASNYNRLHPDNYKMENAKPKYEKRHEELFAEITGKGQLLSEKA